MEKVTCKKVKEGKAIHLGDSQYGMTCDYLLEYHTVLQYSVRKYSTCLRTPILGRKEIR